MRRTPWAQTGVVAALVMGTVLLAPAQAQAATWGRYYDADTTSQAWKQSSASQQRFSASRTTAVPAEQVLAWLRIPGIGDSSSEGNVASTYSARVVQASCRFTYPSPGAVRLTCENRSA